MLYNPRLWCLWLSDPSSWKMNNGMWKVPQRSMLLSLSETVCVVFFSIKTLSQLRMALVPSTPYTTEVRGRLFLYGLIHQEKRYNQQPLCESEWLGEKTKVECASPDHYSSLLSSSSVLSRVTYEVSGSLTDRLIISWLKWYFHPPLKLLKTVRFTEPAVQLFTSSSSCDEVVLPTPTEERNIPFHEAISYVAAALFMLPSNSWIYSFHLRSHGTSSLRPSSASAALCSLVLKAEDSPWTGGLLKPGYKLIVCM